EGLQFGTQSGCSQWIVPLHGGFQLLAQLIHAAPVLLPRLGVEKRPGVAELSARTAGIARDASVAPSCSGRGELAGQDLAARICQEVGDVVKTLGVLEADDVAQP